jgi:CheY-like chemotaxis protein
MNSALSGRRVFVVEDEVMVSWMLEDMLVDLGYKIVGPAARVNQALAIVEAEAIDLAILDINLNGEKSYPVADALTARGVPFAFSTGYNKDGMSAHYRDLPMLQKPYAMPQLAAVLSKLLTPRSRTSEVAGD